MELLGVVSVGAITIICFLAAYAYKTSGRDSKWCPVIAGTLGAILGPVGFVVMPQFPASDAMTAVAVGIVSGFAATGLHQVYKQLGAKNG